MGYGERGARSRKSCCLVSHTLCRSPILCADSVASGPAPITIPKNPGRYQRQVLIIAPVGQAAAETYTCGICGFVMGDVRACPRCKLIVEVAVRDRQSEMQALMDEIGALLSEDEGGPGMTSRSEVLRFEKTGAGTGLFWLLLATDRARQSQT